MIVKSLYKNYEAVIKEDFDFISELTVAKDAMFAIDKNVYAIYKRLFENICSENLIIVNANENNKIIDTSLKICEAMTNMPAKRNAHLISIGGGIIQDITGFTANILYRGIKWTFVPTTLLSACDSCIGGKTSLNYKKYKNLIGTFYPPDNIYICPDFFDTLSDKDFKSGLGEVIKFNIMSGENGLQRISENINLLLDRDHNTIKDFVINSLEYKRQFIEADEFDKGERIKLNFAHTFGHAIEVISDYFIPHGMSVAIGMIMANSISVKRKFLSEQTAKKAEDVLLKVIDIQISYLNVPIDNIIKAMKKDKKQIDKNLTAVLMCDYTNTENLIVVRDVTENEIEFAFDYFKDLYKSNSK